MNMVTTETSGNTNEQATMTSLELLDVINKYRVQDGKNEMSHKNFIQKVRDELEGGELKFQSTYFTSQNKELLCYNLPKDECMLMAMRESKFVRRQTVEYIKNLEEKVTTPALPQTYIEALEHLVVAEKEKVQLQLVNKEQEQTLIEQAPKVKFAEDVNEAKFGISFKDCSKALGLGRNTMMSILRDEKVLQKNNTPYQSYIDRGYFQVRQGVSRYGHITLTTIVTGKGELWLHKFLTKQGHL